MSDTSIVGLAGFGVEGRAAYDYLKGRAKVHIFDEALVDLTGVDAEFHQTLTIPAFVSVVYKTPGIPTSKIVLESPNTRVTTLMDEVLAKVAKQAIGVTGTKGKSTVTALIHHVLKGVGRDAVLFGNIGVADMQLVTEEKPGQIYIIELSSYQCEYLTHSPHVAVLTNLYQEHLSHHGSLEKYREAKLNIARFQGADDVFIDGSDLNTHFAGTVIHPTVEKPFETQLLGEHNQKNCAVALATLEAVGVSEGEAREYIKTFSPLTYRLERVGEYRGVTFYDDSLATIPEATLASIEALGKVDTIILGGEDRGIDFKPFAKTLADTKIKNFIIFPDTGAKMVVDLQDRAITPVSSMEEAVRAAYKLTPSGGTVLLSNASPSFNLFKDYKDKSAQYRKWITDLGHE